MLRVVHKIIIQGYLKCWWSLRVFQKHCSLINSLKKKKAMKIMMWKKYTQTNYTSDSKTCRTPKRSNVASLGH